MDKKNNWLKLKVDFFSTPALKKLRKIAGGDTYLIIYQKLMLLTVNTEGHYKYENIEPTLEEELALIIDEDVDNVKMTLSFLKSSKLAENLEDFIFFPALSNLIGKNDNSTERVAKYREKKKLQSKCNALHFVTCNESNDDVTVTCNNVTALEKEKDIDKEKEKNIKKAQNKKTAPTIPQIPTNQNEEIIAYYNQHSTIKAKLTDKTINNNLTKILKEHTINDVKLVIKYILNNKWHIENGYTGLTHITRPTKFSNKLETAQIALKSITIERLELKSKPIFTEFA